MSQKSTKKSPKKLSTADNVGLVSGLKMEQFTPQKSTEKSLKNLKPGDQFIASAQVLGKQKMSLQGAIQGDGSEFLTIPFEKTGFTFEQIFTGFQSKDNTLFVFDNVDVHVEKSVQPGSAVTIDFIGELRIDKAPMQNMALALNLLKPPLLTATIETSDGDLSDKITPQAVTLKGAPTIEVSLSPAVSLTGATFQVAIVKDKSSKQWEYQPSVEGTIELAGVAHDSLAMACHVGYADKNLNLNAQTKNVSGLFDIPGLTLDTLELSTVLGSASSLALSAAFTAAGKTYQLGGAINETRAGIFTRESKFSLAEFNAIVTSLTGDVIAMPSYDVSLSNLLLGFANADGLYAKESLQSGFTLTTDLEVFGHKGNAHAHLNQQGVELLAGLKNLKVGPVTIKEATLSLNLYKKSSNKEASLMISGEATIEGIEVECKLVYENHQGKWQSILYASLNAEGFVFSSIFPAAKGSFADTLEFKKLGFIYSSFAGTSKDKDFEFNVKKGLQLVGNLKQVPALSSLTSKDDLNLVLSAYLGTTKEIGIALPDTRLNLGKSVKTSPMRIAIELTPEPSFEIIMGIDATVPNQDSPLHFDANLSVGLLEAKGGGTMKNYWENPFGVQGIKIGPALAMQIGINYQQFVVSGIPSSFGFVGGLALGDVSAQMALNISENPTDEILMGQLESLSPANLVSFVNQATGAGIASSDVPNFFTINDLEIYVAPKGGSIGTVEFEQGFSFSADLVLFNKVVSVYARLSDSGIEAAGHLDKIELGPLKISGKKGADAELDIEISTAKQAVFIDGEIDFLGSSVGIFSDISNQGIEFSFEQSFVDLLKYSVEGKSKGKLSDPKSLDFSLRAEFDSALTGYLKNDLANKMNAAINVVNTDISKAQQDVDNAEKIYKAQFNKAKADLDKAKSAADKKLNKAQSDLNVAKAKAASDLASARSQLAKAKMQYDKAFASASNAVSKAQADYNRGLSQAQAKLDVAQRDYTRELTKAENDVKRARRAYDSAVQSANRSFKAAQSKVNSLSSSIKSANSKLKKEKRKFIPNPFKLAQYASTIAGLEIAKGTATAALSVAKGVMNGVTKGAEYAAFETANSTLKAVKQGAKYTAFKGAKLALNAAKTGANYTAFKAAKQTLSAVQKGTQFSAWQAAEKSLVVADAAAREGVNLAQRAVNDVAKSSVYLAFKAAEQTLQAVKQGSSFVAFQSAQVVLEGAKQSAVATLKLSQYVASHSGDIVDVRHVLLQSHLKGILAGDFFKAEVDLSLLGNDFKTKVDFDVNDVAKFIEMLFKQVMAETEKLVVNLA